MIRQASCKRTRTRGRGRSLAAGLVLMGVLVLGVPSLANAGTFSRDGGTLSFAADPGFDDFVDLGVSGDKLQVTGFAQDASFDTVDHVFAPGSGCAPSPDDESVILCDMPTRIVATLGDGSDTWSPAYASIPIPMELDGGPGDDTVEGGDAADTIIGGGTGGDPNKAEGDDLRGNDGNDTIDDAGPLYASLSGDAGDDTLTSASAEAYLYGDNYDGAGGNDTLTATGSDAYLLGGPGNDTLNGSPTADTIDGDEGDDVINGGAGDDQLFGSDGSDRINGQDGNDEIATDYEEEGAGNDVADGGSGDDSFEPTAVRQLFPEFAGADTYIGGPGFDNMDYFWATGPVQISLDGVANDGAVGEGDNIGADIEDVGGTSKNDVIVGNNGPQILSGFEGDDEIQGLGGDDELYGGDFVDTLDGGAGNDLLYGGTLSDELTGGPGRDQLLADDVCTGSGQCFAGDHDILNAADGEPDIVFCHGPNGAETPADSALIDKFDDLKSAGLGVCRDVQVTDDVCAAFGAEQTAPGRCSPPPAGKKCAQAQAKVDLAKAKLKKAEKKAKKAKKGKAKKKAKKKVKRAKSVLKDAKKEQRKKCD